MTFCVYEHWRSDKNQCFYVGKGTRKRAYFLSRKENRRHHRIAAKLKRLGLAIDVRIIADGLSEAEAFRLEIEHIKLLRDRGVDLVNTTNGGEGASGNVVSAETRSKISRATMGRRKPHLIGRRHSARTSSQNKRKISAAQKGKPRPELIGRKLSPEGIERLKNRVFTEEHRRKISEAKKGKAPCRKSVTSCANLKNGADIASMVESGT